MITSTTTTENVVTSYKTGITEILTMHATEVTVIQIEPTHITVDKITAMIIITTTTHSKIKRVITVDVEIDSYNVT